MRYPAASSGESDQPSGLDALVRSRIRDIPDYPKPGILFKDITPLLADNAAFGTVIDSMAARYEGGTVDTVAGVEARGFILAAPVAYRLGAAFVPVRKEGKLPADTYTAAYELEYGTETLEVHRDAFAPGDRVLIVDDVLATGGTASAAAELVKGAGATVVDVSFLVELSFLAGRRNLAGEPLHTVLAV